MQRTLESIGGWLRDEIDDADLLPIANQCAMDAQMSRSRNQNTGLAIAYLAYSIPNPSNRVSMYLINALNLTAASQGAIAAPACDAVFFKYLSEHITLADALRNIARSIEVK